MAQNHSVHQDLISFQRELLKNLAGGEDPSRIAGKAREAIKSLYGYPLPSGAELGMSVNDVCNLRCRHCYYASTHDKSIEQKADLLGEKGWLGIINDSIDAGFRHFSIIGKEPLLSPGITRAIFTELENQKRTIPDIRYEMVTNGTLIEQNIDWLRALDFYFLSISFDGYSDAHDNVRGQGSYVESRDGLRLLKSAGMKNLTVSHAVMPHSVGTLEAMINDLHKAGAEYFSIGFCYPTEKNDQALVVDSEEIFFKAIKQLRNAPKGVDISVNLSMEEDPALLAKVYSNIDKLEGRFAVTEDLAPALIYLLSDSPRIAVQFNVLPVMFYSGFRMDCTGSAIDWCTDLQTQHTRLGFGNALQKNTGELWKHARDVLWEPYTVKYYEKLANALRVVSGESKSSNR